MSYEPRSYDPYAMEKKLNSCVGGGGFDPSVLEEIQEEISVLGSENAIMAQDITDIKGSLNSINSDLIDIKGSLNSLTAAYSTTEHNTGRKWTDGSDIYEKSIVLENIAIEKDTGFNICDATGIAKVFPGEFYSTGECGGNNLATWISDGYVKGKSCATYSSGTVTITITYTKTS